MVIGANVVIGEGAVIPRPDLVNLWGKCTIGQNCKIGAFVEIGDNVVIGDDCLIQSGVYIPPGIRIGDRVFIGPGATFLNDKYPPSYGKHWMPVIVKPDVSIGGRAVILPGVTLHQGAKIGAGAVVTRDVYSGETVAGVPARPIIIEKGENYELDFQRHECREV